VPANIVHAATSAAGAAATYTPPTAVDEAGDSPAATVSCDHASGSVFAIGTTTVTCTATDGDDLNSPVSASFTVIVVGDSDLALTNVPANIVHAATSAAGAAATYTPPTAVDEAGDSVAATVSCDHASGSVFAIGTTTVTCTATDGDDLNSPVSASFTVTVYAPPAISGISPAMATAGSAGFSITVDGTGFVSGASVALDGTFLTTHFVSDTQLTADVPASLAATARLAAVVVVNPFIRLGDPNPQNQSNQWILYILHSGVSLTGTPGVATGGGASATTGGSGAGTPGSVTISAAGDSGTVAVAQYAGNPGGSPSFASSGAYLDAYMEPGSTFVGVNIEDCNLNGGSQVQWWNGTAWVPVSNQTYIAAIGCVSITVDNTTTPSLAQLGGTPFGVANVPPVLSVPGAQSVPYGGQLGFGVSATDVEAADKLTLTASGLPAGLSFTDNGDGTGVVSGVVTAPAGTYTARFIANDGYSDSQVGTVQITVTKAPLTITASSPTATYNGSVPAVTPSYSGLANGEQAPATPPTCTSTAPGSGAAGTYTTSCSGAADPNYSIAYKAGTLTINPAPLTITADDKGPVQYSDPLPAFTWQYRGFVNGEGPGVLGGTTSCTTTAGTTIVTSPAGSYPITCSGQTATNYAITYQGGTLTVTPETAAIQYTGGSWAQLPSSGSASIPLQATVWDSAAKGYPSWGTQDSDGLASDTPGDATKMYVQWAIWPAGSCLSGSPSTIVGPVPVTATSAGVGTASSSFSQSADGSFCVVAQVVGASPSSANGYYSANDAQVVGLAFYTNSGQFATGGGWIADAGSSSGKGTFGFTARYGNTNGSPKGQMVYVWRGTYHGVPADFIIKSNALSTLTLSKNGASSYSATLQGKCSYTVVSEVDGRQLYGEGNDTFSATATDGDNGLSQSSAADSFALTTFQSGNTKLHPIATTPLGGGNIAVHN
jgi:hypothetical protein